MRQEPARDPQQTRPDWARDHSRGPMSSGDDHLPLAALVAAATGEPSSVNERARDDLRLAVYALVRSLKAEGEPPERALIAVKKAADFDSPFGVHAARAAEVRGSVVRWCVEAYYAAT